MIKEENWGVDIRRIRAFFREQPDVAEEHGSFRFRSCRITLTESVSRDMVLWTIPRTVIRMEGGGEDLEAIYHRFFLQFLSSGG